MNINNIDQKPSNERKYTRKYQMEEKREENKPVETPAPMAQNVDEVKMPKSINNNMDDAFNLYKVLWDIDGRIKNAASHIHEVDTDVNKINKRLEADASAEQKWRQSVDKNISTLGESVSDIPDKVEGQIMYEVKRLFNNAEELGRRYGQGLCERLDKSIKEVQATIYKGEEALEFWSLGKKIILCILLGMLSFQIYYNYKMTAKLENLNEQVGLIHSVYKGESKYWFDANDQITYVEFVKSHQERNKK